jgi:hypothetical protein
LRLFYLPPYSPDRAREPRGRRLRSDRHQ